MLLGRKFSTHRLRYTDGALTDSVSSVALDRVRHNKRGIGTSESRSCLFSARREALKKKQELDSSRKSRPNHILGSFEATKLHPVLA